MQLADPNGRVGSCSAARFVMLMGKIWKLQDTKMPNNNG